MLVTEESVRLVLLGSPHAPGCSRGAARSSLCHYKSLARRPVLALQKPIRYSNSIINHAALSLELERAPEHIETQFLGEHLLMVIADCRQEAENVRIKIAYRDLKRDRWLSCPCSGCPHSIKC